MTWPQYRVDHAYRVALLHTNTVGPLSSSTINKLLLTVISAELFKYAVPAKMRLDSYLWPANVCYRGFAAKASAKVLETVSAMGEKYPPLIEEDVIVSVSGEIADKGRI